MRGLVGLIVRLGVLATAAAAVMDVLTKPRAQATRSGAEPSAGAGARRAALRRLAVTAAALIGLAGIGGALVATAGLVPIKASSGHWVITARLLKFVMRQSVATHTLGTSAPPLDDSRLALRGASHYDLGCRPCHGAPGEGLPTIASRMTPQPPDIVRTAPTYSPEELFYIVKHGVKFTGMPAWPSQQRDDEVWAIVAFLLTLPSLDRAEYRTLAGRESSTPALPAPVTAIDPRTAPRADMALCARCHGADGLGRGGAFPRLAGQRAAYLEAALDAYAAGTRQSGVMTPVATALDPPERRALAEHYASLSSEVGSSEPAAWDDGIARGEALALHGSDDRSLPACSGCHGPGGPARNAFYPRLGGQHADYIARQLALFKQNRRGGTRYAHIMRLVASRLTDGQMKDVARYYASLPGGERDAPSWSARAPATPR